MSIIESSLAGQVLDASPMGIIITDTDNRISWLNKTMLGFLASDESTLIGLDFDTLQQSFAHSYDDNSKIWRVADHQNSIHRWLLLVNKEISTGITAWYFSDATELMRLRTENQQMADQLESTATNDPVTGILNRRALMQGLEPQVSRSRRYDNPLSVIVLEINGFQSSKKEVAPVTEHVLRGIGFYLRDQLRWVDLVGRTGEDEFTLVLPETGIEDAEIISKKIAERMSELSLPDIPEITVKVESRIGIATWQKGDDTLRLLDRAHISMQDLATSA